MRGKIAKSQLENERRKRISGGLIPESYTRTTGWLDTASPFCPRRCVRGVYCPEARSQKRDAKLEVGFHKRQDQWEVSPC